MRHQVTPKKLSLSSGKRAAGALALVTATAACFSVFACTARESNAAAAQPVEHAATEAPAAKVNGKNFSLDFAAAECKAGADCTATIKLEALGDFHINDEYPYKFKAAEAAGVEYLGKDSGGKNVFSKQAGDFKKDSKTGATMTVRFKAAKAGNVTISGQYKMSVCSAQNCQLETQEVTTAVVVK